MSDEPPRPPRAGQTIMQELHRMAVAQARDINRHGVVLTDAEVEQFMPEARDIHIQQMERDPYPVDQMLGPLHEWVAQRIAVNLAARARGYDVERTIAAMDKARREKEREQYQEEPILRPMRQTADNY
jgi:hypothetical protein